MKESMGGAEDSENESSWDGDAVLDEVCREGIWILPKSIPHDFTAATNFLLDLAKPFVSKVENGGSTLQLREFHDVFILEKICCKIIKLSVNEIIFIMIHVCMRVMINIMFSVWRQVV